MQRARHDRLARLARTFFAIQWIFAILLVRERLAVAGNTRLVSLDHRWIAEDDCNLVAVMTGGDNLPILVSAEVRKGETAGHLQKVYLSCAASAKPPSAAGAAASITISKD